MTRYQCDFRFDHDKVTDTPQGERCPRVATHMIEWSDGDWPDGVGSRSGWRYSYGCADHLTVAPTSSVKPRRIVPLDSRMTFRQLKAELEKFTEAQLDQTVAWSGDERGGYVRFVWIEPEDIVGEPGDHETWVARSEVGHGVSADDYADAEVCVPAGSVVLIVDGAPPAPRYFKMRNHDVNYWFVAYSLGHCRWILCEHGAVIYDARRNEVQLEHGKLEAFDAAKGAAGEDPCTWSEIPYEQASAQYVIDGKHPRKPLTEFPVGAWFCSEF